LKKAVTRTNRSRQGLSTGLRRFRRGDSPAPRLAGTETIYRPRHFLGAAFLKGDLKVVDSAANAANPSGGEDPTRRDFIHIAAISAAAVGGAAVAWPFIAQMNPSADTMALATVEYDLTKIEPGMQVTINWRGKPLFIRNRTQAQIDAAVKDDSASMPDPQIDAERHKDGKAQWLVLVGSCTHLGCVPTVGGGDYGGWFCPCHGSHYDTAGRIRRGPAPRNLPVPVAAFTDETTIRLG
jgi:ubiquinol-cytochrome c reductase iron-sulfur subunit